VTSKVTSEGGADGRSTSTKEAIRQRVWDLLEGRGVVERGVHGYIPDYRDADIAANQLAALEEWHAARVVKANPDRAQLAVRARALAEGKRVYMAVPRLARDKPFVLLDPSVMSGNAAAAASHQAAMAVGRPVAIAEMELIDLVVCGSVAVTRQGVRIGKGGGYSDLEVALLLEAGLLPASAPLVTTVHQLQVLDEDLPETEHDFRVDVIATPVEVIRPPRYRRPTRILWDQLDEQRIAEIPVLWSRRP
jgi:5-formyltetrahydrofolate cyclo-ligase